jgi:Fe-S cluster assembly scaffold IscU
MSEAVAAPHLSPPLCLQLNAQLTSPSLLDHYNKPRNVGSMAKGDSDVGTGLVGAPACGDVMKLQIRVDPNNNTISDVKFKTFGCGSAIASSSYLTELVRGMTLEDAAKIRNTEIAKELSLPPVKCECLLRSRHANRRVDLNRELN